MRETRDPIVIQGERLADEVRVQIEAQVEAEILDSFKAAMADPPAGKVSNLRIATNVIESTPKNHSNIRVIPDLDREALDTQAEPGRGDTVLKSLNQALHAIMAQDERVLVLGEDILDPYGGAFKVTQGLSSAHPDRVIPTPISEAGIVGVAAGMAMRGLRPVVEIMFGDFLTLAADQLINHAAKFRWMYNDQVKVPLVVRTPMGGRRGYGPTHSQTLEKHFLGVPGLLVLAPTAMGDPGSLLQTAVQVEDPVLFIENKLLYTAKVEDPALRVEFNREPVQLQDAEPAYRLQVKGAPKPDLTLVTYGFMAELSRQAALKLAYESEVFLEILALTQLSPYRLDAVFNSVRNTGRVPAVEEGSLTLGWGAEVVAQCAERMGKDLIAAGRAAALDLPVPASPVLEDQVLPGVNEICQKVEELLSYESPKI